MKVVSLKGDEALVAAGGLSRKANISMVRPVGVGSYVLIHAGFAIEKVKKKEAAATLKILKSI